MGRVSPRAGAKRERWINDGSRGRSPHRRCRPDGAGEWGGAGGCKDFAPDGALKRDGHCLLQNSLQEVLILTECLMPSFILKNDYENLRPKVIKLKLQLAERCSQLNVNQTQILNEFFREILIRAVHESNWQEGIELNKGRTEELSNAAFDDLEDIQGPHLDMNKILRFHRKCSSKTQREKVRRRNSNL